MKKPKTTKAKLETAPEALQYSFNAYQDKLNGMMLIDGCVPEWIVNRILALLATI